ncbi:DNA recombination protein RmuC [Camelimonas abortus]|uniref:DNA recombination protein RmuC homolog n=1 Tax=Camelimonas abortus TaxID=1017184 RepID=A0ABV7LBM7_9HYPH
MQDMWLAAGGLGLSPAQLALAAAAAVAAAFALMLLLLRRRRPRAGGLLHADDVLALLDSHARGMEARLEQLARLQAEMHGGLHAGMQGLGARQAEVQRAVAEQVDMLQHRVGRTLADMAGRTGDGLSELASRLAVIDAAQQNLSALAGEMLSLREVLANKQARGAWGQGRMEAIVRDGLPPGAYSFQATLSNGRRPDCLVRLPGDLPLAIDAKFPLEGFQAFRAARGEAERRAAAARLRQDLAAHVRDIAGKYLIPGETQDLALMFIPSESLYADLLEHFEDVSQSAARSRVIIVSPSLLAVAIQLARAMARDARIRDEARAIQAEVGRLLDDIGRLQERAARLDGHFRQAREDLAALNVSVEKVARRGGRIEALEFDGAA